MAEAGKVRPSEAEEISEDEESVQEGVYTAGQHVFIENSLGLIVTRGVTSADRAAVVLRTTKQRVYIKTYNGWHTWRVPGNLRHLTRAEQTVMAKLVRRR